MALRRGAPFVRRGRATPDWIVLYDSSLWEYAAVPDSLRDLGRDRYTLAHEIRATGDATDALFDRHDAFFLPMSGFGGIDRPGPNVQIYSRQPPR